MGKLYHALVVIYYLYVDYFVLFKTVPEALKHIKPMRDNASVISVQFATVWAHVFHQLYFLCCFIEDLLDLSSSKSSKVIEFRRQLKGFTNTLFTCLTFPFSVAVSLMFWVVFTHDKNNIDEYNILFDYISPELNHVVHTHIVAIVLIELCTTYRQHPQDLTTGFKMICITLAAYFVTVVTLQPFSTIYVYPLFGLLSAFEAVLFGLLNLFLTNLAYVVGHDISTFVWGKHHAVVGKTRMKILF